MSAALVVSTSRDGSVAKRRARHVRADISLPAVSAREAVDGRPLSAVSILEPPTRNLIDLRGACASDDREQQLTRALGELDMALQRGDTVELIWPADRYVKFATTQLAAPLGSVLVNMAHSSDAMVIVHTRTGLPTDFVALPAMDRVRFIVHVNSEEAAMRWEHGDTEPGRRIAAAVRLRAAGWMVNVCIGAVRCFSGWREEYADLVERIAAAGFQHLLLSVAGQDAMRIHAVPSMECLEALETDSGYTFAVTRKQQAEIYAFISSALAQEQHHGHLLRAAA